eukprot:gene9811-7699_t
MPPKAKKDDKKKEEPPVDDGVEREFVEKELVVGYLKSRLGRYQDTGDRLQIDNLKLTDELETQRLNLRDINEFLTNELKARSLTTSALEAKVHELNHLLEAIRKNHEDSMKKTLGGKDKQIQTLENKLEEYEKKSKASADFLDRKDEMESELLNLKQELEQKVKEYEDRLTDTDRQHIQDREKWKRDTATKIKETKIQMMKLTDNQLEMTTKRTIMENEQMSIELGYQSRQTEKLLGRNSGLVDENRDLRRQLELSKQTEEELAKRNNVYQKTIKSLCQRHLGVKTTELDKWTARYDSTAQFLMRCMDDVKEKVVTMVRHDSQFMDEPEVTLLPGNLDDLSNSQRERILAYLLEKMHVFVRSLGLPEQSSSALGRHPPTSPGSSAMVLPPIPSFSRRNTIETTPISKALGSASPQKFGSMGGARSPQALSQQQLQFNGPEVTATWSQPGGLNATVIRTLVQEPTKEDLEVMQHALPPVDELLSKVMSDVRPWGKRSGEQISLAKSGVFLRKGAPGGSQLSKSVQR